MRLRPRHHSLRGSASIAVTVVVAAPTILLALLAGMFLRNEMARPETAVLASLYLCGPLDEATQQEFRFDTTGPVSGTDPYCVRRVERLDTPSGATDLSGGIASGVTSRRDITLTPELSLWPWTDSQRVTYRVTADDGGSLGGFDAERVLSPEQRASSSNAQRALSEQVVLLVYAAVLLIGLFAVVAWVATGRVLRPVQAIRREMADITEHDLSRRVPVPRAVNEIAELAGTVNATLDRLQTAVQENRRFVADASHELRSPITALRAELEIATAHPDLVDWPAVVDAALADTHRLQQLATDLLLLARLDHTPTTGADRDVLDLGGLVREEVEHRRTRHALTVDATDDPVPVRGSRALLCRLLGNLLDNAERHATAAIAIRLTTTRDHAILDVLDDGPGIPPADRERVFDRFTRLDHARTRDTGGTGLGLSIARRIAVTHHGTLHVADPPHLGGAQLVARLPLGSPLGRAGCR